MLRSINSAMHKKIAQLWFFATLVSGCATTPPPPPLKSVLSHSQPETMKRIAIIGFDSVLASGTAPVFKVEGLAYYSQWKKQVEDWRANYQHSKKYRDSAYSSFVHALQEHLQWEVVPLQEILTHEDYNQLLQQSIRRHKQLRSKGYRKASARETELGRFDFSPAKQLRFPRPKLFKKSEWNSIFEKLNVDAIALVRIATMYDRFINTIYLRSSMSMKIYTENANEPIWTHSIQRTKSSDGVEAALEFREAHWKAMLQTIRNGTQEMFGRDQEDDPSQRMEGG